MPMTIRVIVLAIDNRTAGMEGKGVSLRVAVAGDDRPPTEGHVIIRGRDNKEKLKQNRRLVRERRPPGKARRRQLVEFDEFLQVVEAGLGGGYGLGEEVFGAVGEFALQAGVEGGVGKGKSRFEGREGGKR